MPLSEGARFGTYEILAPLGAGGMGEVYRARDSKLGREVAIKVLREELSQDKERLSRFEREAKLLAQVNHANIATLYGLEEHDGQQFLVMELVEGETLAERIARGPIPINEAIPLFLQLAEGLEAAHEKGIIHRDLKPANIKIGLDDKPKILDFGLAKAFVGDMESDTASSQSPTLTKGTALGTIMGTASYMSPEQARGKVADKRADIWAFGVVLYEVLTGGRLFAGETVSDVLAAVLTRAPDLDALPRDTPSRIRHLLSRCLEKDPKRRLRDIGEAHIAMTDALASPSPPIEPIAAGRRSRALLWAALGGAAFAMLLTWIFARAPESNRMDAGVGRATIKLPDGQSQRRLLTSIAISPDGRLLAYAAEDGAGSALFLRPLDSFETRRLAGTEGADMPFFSPDGEWVGFFAAGKLKKVSVDRGSAVTIARAPLAHGASWGPDDIIVFSDTGLHRVSADGGAPEQLTRPDFDETGYSHVWPHHMPGARDVLFTIWDMDNDKNVGILNLETGEWRKIDLGGDVYVRQYLPTGHLLFAAPTRSGGLFAAPFDPEGFSVTGTTVSVIDDVRFLFSWSAWPYVAVSQSGTIVYLRESSEPAVLTWMDRDGAFRARRAGSPSGSRVQPTC